MPTKRPKMSDVMAQNQELAALNVALQQSNRDKDAELALLKKELEMQLEIKAELKKNEALREEVDQYKKQAEAVPFWKAWTHSAFRK